MRLRLSLSALSLALACGAAQAQVSDGVIRIGVMTDMSGLYSDITGPGSVVAARMAVEDSGLAAKGVKVEVLGADHQNKPDVGSNIVRRWIDIDKVDVIVDVPTSSIALAVSQIVREKNKVFLVSGAATSDLTGKACSPNNVHWTYDTWALANGTGKAIVQTGGKTWFFVTADYAFGHALERDTAAVVEANGGKVWGRAPPLPRHRLLLLPAEGAGLQGAGHRVRQCRRRHHQLDQAGGEFGIVNEGTSLAGLLVFVNDVHALGLRTAQGLIFTESFYWDRNEGAAPSPNGSRRSPRATCPRWCRPASTARSRTISRRSRRCRTTPTAKRSSPR